MPVVVSFKNHRWRWPLALFVITVIAVVMRWYYVSTAVVLDPVRGDAVQYYSYAWNLVNHGVFSNTAPGSTSVIPDNYRDPGYPLFLAIWMKAFGTGDSWYVAVLLCQVLLGALTVTLTAQLGRSWLSLPWAIFAGLLMAVWPHSITISGYLLSETLFGFMCALSMLLCVNACQKNDIWRAILAGFLFGAAALTNAIFLPFGILLASLLAWRKLASGKICLAIAVGALLLPGAWAIRSAQIPPSTAGNSSSGRALLTLVVGSRPEFTSAWRESISGDASTQASKTNTLHAFQAEVEGLQKNKVRGAEVILRRLGSQPWRYAYWYLIQKPCLLWGWDIQIGQGEIYVYPTRRSPFDTNAYWIAIYAICRALNLPLMLLALASVFIVTLKLEGSAKSHIRRNRQALVSVICLTAFVTAVYTALQADARYSIAFRSFEMLLATTSLASFFLWWRNRRAKAMVEVGVASKDLE